tara:strand:- start:12328 stop:13158 length:831 start_codon:yes stop_codon:yes gene_type:complete
MKGSKMGELQIRTFRDQSTDRTEVYELCARFACDVLSMIDDATGTDPENGSPEVAEEYLRFRNWLGPNIVQMTQSSVVGPLLSGLTVFDDGSASFVGGNFTSRKHKDVAMGTEGRIRWICSEVPSLIDAYGELYEEEVEPAIKLVERASFMVENGANPEDLYEIVEELETLYLHCSPGARLVRGDEKAIASARDTCIEAVAFINKEYERRSKIQCQIDAGEVEGETSEEKISNAKRMLEFTEDHIEETSRRLEALNSNRKAILAEIKEYERIRDGS